MLAAYGHLALILAVALLLVVGANRLALSTLRAGDSGLRRIWRLHYLSACITSLPVIAMSATFEMWIPHPFGHLLPGVGVLVVAMWCALCIVLCQVALATSWFNAARANFLLLILAAISGSAWWLRYDSQKDIGYGHSLCEHVCLTFRSSGPINRFAIDVAA